MAEIQQIPRPVERHITICGIKVRKPSELEPYEVAFVVLGLVSCLAALGMTIERLATTPHTSNDFVFAFLLFVNILFIIYYVLHGVFMERPFEILVSLITVLIVMVYCIVDYATNEKKRSDLKLVRLIVVCLLGPVDIALSCLVAWKFFEGPGNLIFRLVGGNVGLQRMCKTYYIFTAFLGFGLQMVIVLLVLLLLSSEKNTLADSEKWIIGIGVPLSCVAVLIGRLGARLENQIMMYAFMVFCTAQSAYIIFLFDKTGDKLGSAKPRKKILYGSIIAAGAVGLAVQIGVISLSVLVMKNFGKGLKEILYPQEGRVNTQGDNYSSFTNNREG